MSSPARKARRAFREWLDTEPRVTAVAPGRVNLVGGHVDYNDGVVLPVAIDRYTAVAAGRRTDGRIRVRSLRLDATVEAPADTVPDGWAAYVLGTAAVLSADVDRELGADLLIASDVPMGAGLSSSAALEVAVAGALNTMYELGQSPATLADVAWRAETQRVGMSCGIMDQLAVACGQSGTVLRIDCRDRSVETIPVDAGAVDIVVFDTTVEHELADSGFNDRVAECQEAVARLDAVLERPVAALRDVTPAEVETHRCTLGEPYARRARHVTTELERVDQAGAALREGAYERVGAAMTASHESLRDDYEVSCAELDAAVEALTDRSGVHGARMVGGGWGGSAVALVDPARTASVTKAAAETYEAATGGSPEVYTTAIGDGLRVES